MSNPYVGEIRLFAGNFPPQGWAFCEGQLLPISENEVLFNLIGTTYGGDGQTTFALPDLRGRVPIHQGQGPGLSPRTIGEAGGAESETLVAAQIPPHAHVLTASTAAATAGTTAGNVTAAAGAGTTTKMYAVATASPTNLAAAAVSDVGNGHAHENRMPYLAVSYIISLFGIFPPQN